MANTSDKKEAILEAMLGLIAERGFHDAPMSLLARRSGASPGVIYHYFPSKDDLIRALYDRVAAGKREALLRGYSDTMTPHNAFLLLWQNTYRFYRTHPRETRFLDQYLNSPYCTRGAMDQPHSGEPGTERIVALFQPRKKGGVLKDLPSEALNGLTFGLLSGLARAPKAFSAATLREIAETVWKALTAE